MRAIVGTHLPTLPRNSVAKAALRGEGVRKEFADLRLGPVWERAIELAGMTNLQASGEMGYHDSSSVARWIQCADDVKFERLWAVKRLRPALIAALAEAEGQRVRVQTIVTIERTA